MVALWAVPQKLSPGKPTRGTITWYIITSRGLLDTSCYFMKVNQLPQNNLDLEKHSLSESSRAQQGGVGKFRLWFALIWYFQLLHWLQGFLPLVSHDGHWTSTPGTSCHRPGSSSLRFVQSQADTRRATARSWGACGRNEVLVAPQFLRANIQCIGQALIHKNGYKLCGYRWL